MEELQRFELSTKYTPLILYAFFQSAYTLFELTMTKDGVDPSLDALGTATAIDMEPKPSVIQEERHRDPKAGWKVSKTGDGDTAMALFDNPDEVDEILDPEEERKLVRKIDFMILPCLMVCYCFFYIDKVCLPRTPNIPALYQR